MMWPADKPSVALIGYRGSGKSSVGKLLADVLGVSFVDTDDLVMATAGRSIAGIFSERGEAAFRRMECEAIARAVAADPGVIAVGGGAVLDPNNVDRLRAAAVIVYLTATPETLWRRIEADPSSAGTRPALSDAAGLDEVRTVLSAREPRYEAAADLQIDTEHKSPRQVAVEIAAAKSKASR